MASFLFNSSVQLGSANSLTSTLWWSLYNSYSFPLLLFMWLVPFWWLLFIFRCYKVLSGPMSIFNVTVDTVTSFILGSHQSHGLVSFPGEGIGPWPILCALLIVFPSLPCSSCFLHRCRMGVVRRKKAKVFHYVALVVVLSWISIIFVNGKYNFLCNISCGLMQINL